MTTLRRKRQSQRQGQTLKNKNQKQLSEFSPIGNGNEFTGITPETIKDDSETKKTTFPAERLAAMVRPKDKEEITVGTIKSKTFGTVSAITMEADEGEKQGTVSTEKTAGHSAGPVTKSKPSPVELGDLMLI